jgi:hypothetical protein
MVKYNCQFSGWILAKISLAGQKMTAFFLHANWRDFKGGEKMYELSKELDINKIALVNSGMCWQGSGQSMNVVDRSDGIACYVS